MTYIDINKDEMCAVQELQTVFRDTVDTAVHIITSMMGMLSGNCTTDASMTVIFSLAAVKFSRI